MSLSINSRKPIKMPVSPLQILLLIQLDQEPKYGYEMLKTLKEEFKGTWEPKTGTVYPALKSLEKKGYIVTQTREDTDYYIITEKGKTVFELMLQHLEASIDFSIKYISVVFKWLTIERKQGALELMNKLTKKEQLMSQALLFEFVKNIEASIKEPFLKQIKEISQNRLKTINKLLENTK
ncbi:PadR family transcriptional regulator [Thermoproteota archaeon]